MYVTCVPWSGLRHCSYRLLYKERTEFAVIWVLHPLEGLPCNVGWFLQCCVEDCYVVLGVVSVEKASHTVCHTENKLKVKIAIVSSLWCNEDTL